ncbi:MAG TPA: hypothetical protein VKU62_08785, partial [Thermoanaerobaculia bacterium]|nr:hypothetical protein [Thermoanaerobaculia bacterium]
IGAHSIGGQSVGSFGPSSTTVHVTFEPGLIGRIVEAGGAAGYNRVLGDFNDNGSMRLAIRRSG